MARVRVCEANGEVIELEGSDLVVLVRRDNRVHMVTVGEDGEACQLLNEAVLAIAGPSTLH